MLKTRSNAHNEEHGAFPWGGNTPKDQVDTIFLSSCHPAVVLESAFEAHSTLILLHDRNDAINNVTKFHPK